MMNISTTPKAAPGIASGKATSAGAAALKALRTAALFVVLILAALVAALFVLDRLVFPGMEDQRKLGAQAWAQENKKVHDQNKWRNLSSPDKPEWTSALYPVQAGSSKQRRILVLGDSFVWGDGYANLNDIWWRQLGRELQHRGYDQVDVIAAGLCGAATKEQLGYAKKLVPIYHPDLIIWGFSADDPDEGCVRLCYVPPEPLFDKACAAMARALPNFTMALQTWRGRQRMLELSGPRYGYDYATWELKLLEGKNFAKFKNTVAQIAAFRKETNVPGFVLTLPNSPNPAYFNERYARARSVFEAAGIPFYDTLPALVKEFSGGQAVSLTVNPLNGHPGAAETHAFAVEAVNILEKSYGRSLGEKSPQVEARQSAELHVNDVMPPVIMAVTEPAAGEVHFNYPPDNSLALNMPIRKPYAQFNLETPVPLRKIELSGKGLKGATLYTTHMGDGKGYDDGALQTLPWRAGKSVAWIMPANTHMALPVNTVRIVAKFDAADRALVLKLTPQ